MLCQTHNRLPRHFVEVMKDGKKEMEIAPYLFYNPDTKKPYAGLRRAFDAALTQVGIRDFRFHDLRHTYANQAMMSGKIDIATLSRLLGHKNLKMTMRYSHFAPAHLTNAAHVIDEVFKISTDTKVTQPTVQDVANSLTSF
jgi:integrase